MSLVQVNITSCQLEDAILATGSIIWCGNLCKVNIDDYHSDSHLCFAMDVNKIQNNNIDLHTIT